MGWLEGRVSHAGERESGPLQVMYGIDGREDLPEEELSHLEGYMGSAPVRIGNRAATQLQLPIYHDGWIELTRNLEWLIDHWDQPDEGIWETRGGRRDYTYSRLMSCYESRAVDAWSREAAPHQRRHGSDRQTSCQRR